MLSIFRKKLENSRNDFSFMLKSRKDDEEMKEKKLFTKKAKLENQNCLVLCT